MDGNGLRLEKLAPVPQSPANLNRPHAKQLTSAISPKADKWHNLYNNVRLSVHKTAVNKREHVRSLRFNRVIQ